MIGIIGGSGFYDVGGFVAEGKKNISTPFGKPSCAFMMGKFAGRRVIFLQRHGLKHRIPPHKINYRANIWALKKLGVQWILSFSASGGISSGMHPGLIVIPDQIIDMSKNREFTFFSGKGKVVHIDFTEPYCPSLRNILIRAARKAKISLKKSGTYVCTEGPRLETKAEIKFFSRFGADVVGMTGMPEASLAREAELCYAGIAVVTNYAAGIEDKKLTATEVVYMMRKTAKKLNRLLQEVIPMIPFENICSCQEALKEAKV